MPKRKPKRKRGGQPGNQNARKHGFYSKRVTEEDRLYCQAGRAEGIPAPVAMMRGRIAAALRQDPGNHRVIREAARELIKFYRSKGKLDASDATDIKKLADGIVAQVRGKSPKRETKRGYYDDVRRTE